MAISMARRDQTQMLAFLFGQRESANEVLARSVGKVRSSGGGLKEKVARHQDDLSWKSATRCRSRERPLQLVRCRGVDKRVAELAVGCGGVDRARLACQEAGEFSDRAHQWGRENDGGVLLHPEFQ
jgi:hypothetical protein